MAFLDSRPGGNPDRRSRTPAAAGERSGSRRRGAGIAYILSGRRVGGLLPIGLPATAGVVRATLRRPRVINDVLSTDDVRILLDRAVRATASD